MYPTGSASNSVDRARELDVFDSCLSIVSYNDGYLSPISARSYDGLGTTSQTAEATAQTLSSSSLQECGSNRFNPTKVSSPALGRKTSRGSNANGAGRRKMQTTVAIRDKSPHRFKVLPLNQIRIIKDASSKPQPGTTIRKNWAAGLRTTGKATTTTTGLGQPDIQPPAVASCERLSYEFNESGDLPNPQDESWTSDGEDGNLSVRDSLEQESEHSSSSLTLVQEQPDTCPHAECATDDLKTNYPKHEFDIFLEGLDPSRATPSPNTLDFGTYGSLTLSPPPEPVRKYRSLNTLEDFESIYDSPLNSPSITRTRARSSIISEPRHDSSGRRATDGSLASPSRARTRDRQKIALRRHAIYAQPGLQIAYCSDGDHPQKEDYPGSAPSAVVFSEPGTKITAALSRDELALHGRPTTDTTYFKTSTPLKTSVFSTSEDRSPNSVQGIPSPLRIVKRDFDSVDAITELVDFAGLHETPQGYSSVVSELMKEVDVAIEAWGMIGNYI